MEPVSTTQVGPLTVELHYDTDPEDPRTYDCKVGEIIHWHRRYNLGDRQVTDTELRALERGGLELLERYLRRAEDSLLMLPLTLLDHSGLSIRVGRGAWACDPGGWDSGTVGVIYVTPTDLKRVGLPADTDLRPLLQDEVETYDQYLRGDVYEVVIKEGEEELESCSGIYGLDEAERYGVETAQGILDWRVDHPHSVSV